MGRTVIVAEKPSVAKTLAKVLPYHVTSVAGHITQLQFKIHHKSSWLKVPLKALLKDELVVKNKQRSNFQGLDSLGNDPIEDLVLATDPDEQGHKIANDIFRYVSTIAKVQKVSRMFLESVTPSSIKSAYEKRTTLDLSQGYPAELRGRLDLIFGATLTRYASLENYNLSKRWTTFYTGRVQTPTLNFVVDREKEILNFKPVLYYLNYVNQEPFTQLSFRSQTPIEKAVLKVVKEELYEVENQEGLNTDLFLRTLAKEHAVFRKLGKNVTNLLNKMYLEGKITYPRTENGSYRGFPQVLEMCESLFKEHFKREPLRPKKFKKVKNPDHAPVSPLVLPSETEDPLEQKVLGTLYSHMLKVFSGSNCYKKITYGLKTDLKDVKLVLLEEVSKNYKDSFRSFKSLPRIKNPIEVELLSEAKESLPPPRYTSSTLLKQMEAAKIGTKSTRVSVIEQLINHQYLYHMKDHLFVKVKGLALIKFWSQRFKEIVSSQLTRSIEEEFKDLKCEKDLIVKEHNYKEFLTSRLIDPNQDGRAV